jgi:ACS family hexuronate transporter-like MFS transporter
MLTPLANGLRSLAIFRFLLGAAESPNWPAAAKLVSEWFPKHERGLATALFDRGSSIGGAVAPFIVLGIYFRWGWRSAFVVPGTLVLLWLVVWQRFYHPPAAHPPISAQEFQLIAADKKESAQPQEHISRAWHDLLKFPQTWETMVAGFSPIRFSSLPPIGFRFIW